MNENKPPTVLSYAVDALSMAVAIAAGPGGVGLLASIIGTESPLLNVVTQFGVRLLSKILPSLTAPTVTDEELTAHLASIGHKVEPYDPMATFQAALVQAGG